MSCSNVGANIVKKNRSKEREDSGVSSHKDIEGFVQWIDEEDARQMAMIDVYDEKRGVGSTVNGWKVIRVDKDPSSGYLAKLYEKDGHFAYVTAGTDITSGQDIIADISQQFGFETKQYEQSIGYAQKLKEQYGNNLVFVGHSLGGGLASANSRATGIDAITFNSAALSDRYRNYKGKGYIDSNIAAYINDGDFLDYTNEVLFGQKVEGKIIRRSVPSSKLPNLQGIPYTGIYQLRRGVIIHMDAGV